MSKYKMEMDELIDLANEIGQHIYNSGINCSITDGFCISELEVKCLIADFLYKKHHDQGAEDYFSQQNDSGMRYVHCVSCNNKMRFSEAKSINSRIGDSDYMVKQLADEIFVYRYDSWYCIGCYKGMPSQPAFIPVIQSKQHKQPKPGIIYFLSDNSGHTKIGRTTNLSKRLESFTMPVEPTLLHSIKVSDFKKAEKIFHSHYDIYSKRGEWFTLFESEITNIQNGNYPEGINKLLMED